MKLKWLIIVGIVTAIIAGIAMMPATVLENPVNQRLGNQASFRVTSGSVWSGAGMLTWRGTNPRLAPLEIPLNWSWAPSTLTLGRMSFDIQLQGRVVRGQVRVGGGLQNVIISQANLDSSLEVVSRFHRNMQQLRTSGDINFKSRGALSIGYASPLHMQGDVLATVNNVRLRSISNDAFGNYEGKLMFSGSAIRYQVDNSSGMLQLNGNGLITLGTSGSRQFSYKGTAGTSRTAPFWLPAALLAVGTPALDGRFAINYKTNF